MERREISGKIGNWDSVVNIIVSKFMGESAGVPA
jgi:hypothetical protein